MRGKKEQYRRLLLCGSKRIHESGEKIPPDVGRDLCVPPETHTGASLQPMHSSFY